MSDTKFSKKKSITGKTLFLRNEFPELDNLYNKLESLYQVIEELNARKDECNSRIQQFYCFNTAGVQSRLETTANHIQLLNLELTQVSNEQKAIVGRIEEFSFKASSGSDPRYWFSSQRTTYKKLLDEALEKNKLLGNRRKSLEDNKKKLHDTYQFNEKILEEHNSFNIEAAINNCNKLEESLSDHLAQEKILKANEILVEERIQEPFEILRDKRKEMGLINHKIASVASYETALDQAPDGRSRARVHTQCEEEFGSPNPNYIMRELQTELRKLKTDSNKLYGKIVEDVHSSLLTVGTLVIDGNNLCYQGENFIALNALKALVPVLANKYKVVLIFDAGIRYQLRMNENELAKLFSEKIKIFVMPDGTRADETILNIAGQDQTIYVISNDRFADFPCKSAVLEKRVFNHQIADDRIQINKLNISEKFL